MYGGDATRHVVVFALYAAFSFYLSPLSKQTPLGSVLQHIVLMYVQQQYRERLKSFSVLLSITQAAPDRNTHNLGKGI